MTVRAKFKCESVADSQDDSTTIRLTAVVDGSEENKKFFKWTPNGSITIGTVNEEAAKQFEVGKEYYVDFIPLVTLLLALLFSAPAMAQGSTGSYGSYGSSGSSTMRSGGSTGSYATSSYGGGHSGSMSYAELRRHVQNHHGLAVVGKSYEELWAMHEQAHAEENARSSRRRGLFGWRR